MAKEKDEEKILEKRLKALENKYQNNLFSDSNRDLPEDLPEQKSPKNIEMLEVPEIKEAPKIREAPKIIKSKIKNKKNISKHLIKKLKIPLIKKADVQGSNVKKPSAIEIKRVAENIKKIKKEMGKVVMGQEKIIDGLIMGLLCNAHVLVEGVPGIAKTLAIRALGAASGCTVKQILLGLLIILLIKDLKLLRDLFLQIF